MNIFEDEKQDAYNFIYFIYRYKKVLLWSLILGLVLGGIHFTIGQEKFRSTGIIYPANPYSRDQIISNPQFGYDIEAERLMQLLESRSLMDRVIEQFKLVDYYEVDTNKNGWKNSLHLKYLADVSFKRSKYNSVILQAEMENPEMAANIINFIIKDVNRYRKQIFQKNIDDELIYLKNRSDEQKEKYRAIRNKIYSVKDTNNLENIIENYLLKSAKDVYYPSEFIDRVDMVDWLEQYKTEKHKFQDYKLDYQKALDVAQRPVLKDYVVDAGIPVYKAVSPSIFLIPGYGFVAVILTLLAIAVFTFWQKVSAEMDVRKKH